MNLEVRRKLDWSDEYATEGELWMDGKFSGYTLEPPRRDPPNKPRAIPCGTYDVTWAFSPKHNRFVPLVENVPDFTGIEIHIGNYPKDTLGCLLVGNVRGRDLIQQSTAAVNEVWEQVHTAYMANDPITITYTES